METDRFDTVVQQFPVFYSDGNDCQRVADNIIQEIPLTIVVNDETVITIACAGIHTKELAVGFLRSEGIVESREDIESIAIDTSERQISMSISRPIPRSEERSIFSSGARHTTRVDTGKPTVSELRITGTVVLSLMADHLAVTELHEITRGTHCSSLAQAEGGILVSREDIGRHNTIDMLGGYSLLNGIDCSDKILITTGRVSSEITFKAIKLGTPIVLSHAVPTSRAIEIAEDMGITIAGYIKGETMRLYTHKERVIR